MQKYFSNKNYQLAEIISMLMNDLHNTNKYENILFVRTTTTGEWMDNLLLNNDKAVRICYVVKKSNTRCHKNTIFISSDKFIDTLLSMNKKFDLICIDPYHEYYESNRDFELIISLLSNDGVIISHDCYPMNKLMASPKFINGWWSGETYIALVNQSYLNPTMYFGILNIDTGIGIISKNKFEMLENNFDRNKQKELLELHKDANKDENKYSECYDYFTSNSKEIINTIYLE